MIYKHLKNTTQATKANSRMDKQGIKNRQISLWMLCALWDRSFNSAITEYGGIQEV